MNCDLSKEGGGTTMSCASGNFDELERVVCVCMCVYVVGSEGGCAPSILILRARIERETLAADPSPFPARVVRVGAAEFTGEGDHANAETACSGCAAV
mmetsp:Transcript_103191/g.166370  ORF Transcript_103191/g.166370 Transcript_103191/m.166370 type:complete len:98 (-) Transcript_103191:23-316(-)